MYDAISVANSDPEADFLDKIQTKVFLLIIHVTSIEYFRIEYLFFLQP
jgi:hypothetical protein